MMRTLLFSGFAVSMVALGGCDCGPAMFESPDASRADAGRPPPPPPPSDAGPPLPVDDWDGGVRFAKQASLAMRPRSVWSLGGQSVWAVGDANAVFRFDARGWQKLTLPGSDGIEWRDVRGDRASIWIVGEREGEGSFLYVSRLDVIRPVPLEKPHLIFADEREGLWVGGADGELGALLYSADNGATWVSAPLPEGPPIVGGWLAPYVSGYPPPRHQPSPHVFRSNGGHLREYETELDLWEWLEGYPISSQPLTGPMFLYREQLWVEGVLAGRSALLKWEKFVAQPVLLEGYVAAAIWGFSKDDLWTVGGDRIVRRDATGGWPSLRIPGEDLVAVHGAIASDVWILSRDGDVFHRTH